MNSAEGKQFIERLAVVETKLDTIHEINQRMEKKLDYYIDKTETLETNMAKLNADLKWFKRIGVAFWSLLSIAFAWLLRRS